jgi:hypothetical protein
VGFAGELYTLGGRIGETRELVRNQIVIAVLERLYCLWPLSLALVCGFVALPFMHGGSGVVASALLFAVWMNTFAALFIVVAGAPGLFRTWRRWATGLSLVVLASALTASYLLIRH